MIYDVYRGVWFTLPGRHAIFSDEMTQIWWYILKLVISIIIAVYTILVHIAYQADSLIKPINDLWCVKMGLVDASWPPRNILGWDDASMMVHIKASDLNYPCCIHYPSTHRLPNVHFNNAYQWSMMCIDGSGLCFLAATQYSRMRWRKYDGTY